MEAYKTVFYNYYRTVNAGVYQADEKERLLSLFGAACGMEAQALTVCHDTVLQVEREGLNDPIICARFLLMSQFLRDVPQALVDAAHVISDWYAQKRGQDDSHEQTRGMWCRSLYRNPESVERGLFEYGAGKDTMAMKTLENVYRRGGGESWQLPEMLALIAHGMGDALKTLIYAVEARLIDGESILSIPWLDALAREAEAALNPEEAAAILARVPGSKRGSFSIGFTG